MPDHPIMPNDLTMPTAPPADRGARVLAFWRQVNRCRECSTIAPWRKFPLGRRGTTRFGLMILGEAPGRVSLENGRPFSNPRNLVIRRAFARAVAPRDIEPEQLFYFSDTVKCWPSSPTGANRSPSNGENANCVRRHLRRELELASPRVIIAFGARAAAAALGRPVKLATMHAQPIAIDGGIRVIPLMHPSTINIAGMRRVGIRSLDDYEAQLTELIRDEAASALVLFDADLTGSASQRFD